MIPWDIPTSDEEIPRLTHIYRNQHFLVWLAAICLTILAVALTYYLYRYGNLVRILHSHEQKKGLEYTGSQYSFKDPLIVTIPQVRNI